MDNPTELANAFLNQYYTLFDQKATRANVCGLYHPSESMLSYEGDQRIGAEAISTKYTSMPFDNLFRTITTVDALPLSGGSPGVLILVLGQLKTESEHDKPMGFAQSFVLRPFNNSIFIFNDSFRLTLHHG